LYDRDEGGISHGNLTGKRYVDNGDDGIRGLADVAGAGAAQLAVVGANVGRGGCW
jgi:hypothetical protein